MRKLRTLALAAATLTGLCPAIAQQYPVVPDHSVVGRIGQTGQSGPAQAIPFDVLAPQLGIHTLPEIYAADPAYGMKCDGVTDDSASLQLAVNAAATAGNGSGAWVVLPAGTCELYSSIYRNTFTAPGALTVPGIKIKGQGRGVTILDTHVANDYAISVNPAWRAAHQAAFGATVGTSGALASNTYYLKITENDGLGNVISVTLPKSYVVTGPSGSLAITLPALPGLYTYNLYFDTASTPAHYALVNGSNASAIAGGQTVTITAIGTAATPVTSPAAVWQEASIRDLSITSSAGTAGAGCISFFKVGYSDLTNVNCNHLNGDGFNLQAYTGDVDGSFNVAIHSSKFDTIAGTCINAAGNVLETSNFTVDDRTALNVCGTAPANIGTSVTVSAIPNNASPVVTTSTAHNLHAGDQVAFSVTGITLASAYYRVGATVASNTFNLVDLNGNAVDTTSLGAFSSGTVALAWRPPIIQNGVITGGGGCLAWTGLIGTFKNLDFTQCNNFAMYLTEAGSNDNASIENVDFENTAGKGLYAAAITGGTLKNFECLGTASLGKTISCVQLGTGFAGGGVSNFLIDVGKVRLDSATAPATAFEQFQNTNIGATFTDTTRVRNITWQAFDATNQSRTSGFVYDSIAGNVQFSISAANTAKLIPIGFGGCLPLHLKSPGEWVCYHVPSTGITGAVTGGLTPATSYNCYAHNSATNLSPYSLSFACNSHATALNEGYSVDSTDGSYTFIGTATTDGSGNFQTSGAQTSQYPASNPATPTTSLTGVLQAAQEPAHTGDMTNSAGSLTTTVSSVTGTTTNDNAAAGKVGEYVQSFARNSTATVTFTNASPTVVTHTAHGMTAANNNCSVVSFTNSGGALPTGITSATSGPPGTTYFVSIIDTNTYHIASSVANCLAGTFVNTSSTGSGTQTAGYNSGNLLTSTATDFGGISLTAGDWDVSVTINYQFAATTVGQLLVAAVANSSATLPGSAQLSSFNFGTTGVTPAGGFTMNTAMVRTSLSGTTTVFCDAFVTFTTSTAFGSCFMRARRVR